jgi:hypothetical protein
MRERELPYAVLPLLFRQGAAEKAPMSFTEDRGHDATATPPPNLGQ